MTNSELSANRFKQKCVLITGGGAGLGAATAKRIAAEGGHPILLDVQAEKVEAVAKACGGIAVVGSALEASDIERAVSIANERHGGVDVLVTCAGLETYGGVEEVDFDQWKHVININLDGAVLAVRACLPSMKAKGKGAIVLVSSIGGLVGSASNLAYGTAKAGILGMNRSIAIDYGPMNIRCNAISPGMAHSELVDRALNAMSHVTGESIEQVTAKLIKPMPLGRIGEAHEIASAIAFLASDDASYMTGSNLVIDGGLTAVEPGLSHVAP
jgi:NAD(P)-dependent dehydrogenase (short-subunit alcohol dehydrogenase family)